YDMDYQGAVQHQKIGIDSRSPVFFINTPLFALLMVPFVALPFAASLWAWRALGLVLLIWGISMLAKMLGMSPARGVAALAIVLASSASFNVFFMGQNTVLLLVIWVVAWRLMETRREGWAGLVLATGAGLKPQLFWLAPIVLLAERRRCSLRAFVMGLCAIGVSQVALVGMDGVRTLATFLASPDYAALQETHCLPKMYSVLAVLRFVSGIQVHPLLAWPAVAIPLAVLVWAAGWRASSHEKGNGTILAAGVLGTLLGAPHLFGHDLLLAVFPVMILYARMQATGASLSVQRSVQVGIFALLVLGWVNQWAMWRGQITPSLATFQWATLILVAMLILNLTMLREARPERRQVAVGSDVAR
ncbi:MAG: DUF2029 domain-containing protein, partial [Syntrophomonadaceae bacterium]|nr:DUF2029 domain-containing protein [Syntrophomonadaceae bacterium]